MFVHCGITEVSGSLAEAYFAVSDHDLDTIRLGRNSFRPCPEKEGNPAFD